MTFSTPTRFLAAAALVALAACGGSKTTTSTTTVASAAPTTEAQREQSALPMAGVAAMPQGMNCGAVKPVWVNLNTKAYHMSGDPYYGKTKNGKYECPSAAAADGYHAAGAMHGKKRMGSGMSGAMSGAASPDGGSTP